MASKTVRNAVNAGITFAVIIVFLALIGFTVTGAGLIGKMFGNPTPAGQMPAVGYLVAFLSILGIWNGSLASRPTGDTLQVPPLPKMLLAGLIAGLVTGIPTAVLAVIFASLLANGTDPRPYLSMVSPDSMRLFLFNAGNTAVLLHPVLLVVTGVLGAFLSFTLRRMALRKKIGSGISTAAGRVSRVSLVERIRSMPYAIFLLYALIAVVMFLLPRQWGSYWNYIIGTVGIYVILGLGLNIIVGFAGQLVLGYVAFFAIGAYSAALLTSPQPHALGWNFWVVVVAGIILAALTGVLLGLPILRLRGDYLAIVTLGFGEIIRIMLRSDVLTPLTAGPRGVREIGGPTLFGQNISSDINFLYLIILAVLIMIFVTRRLQNSRTGRAWVAIREDEVAARATGINTFKSKLLALAIGAAFAGLGGVLFASRNQFTGPEDHTLMVSINVLALVIVGGMGSIPGIIMGAFALKGLPEMLRELESYRLMFFGGLLVMMMILRPEGLWPSGRPKLENKQDMEITVDSALSAVEKPAAEQPARAEGA
jgi:ABC-type branched-subunit amino acid transport system permease subunit